MQNLFYRTPPVELIKKEAKFSKIFVENNLLLNIEAAVQRCS